MLMKYHLFEQVGGLLIVPSISLSRMLSVWTGEPTWVKFD